MTNDPSPVTGPTMKRGKSEQSVETPEDFMLAVKKRFGRIVFDLAADSSNFKAAKFFCKEEDSLKQSWANIYRRYPDLDGGWFWLNCEYDDIAPWTSKCAAEMELGARILLLTPASVGSNWFKQWVRPSAHTIFLNGRIKFVGHKTAYPKDLAIHVYCCGVTGDSIWKWK